MSRVFSKLERPVFLLGNEYTEVLKLTMTFNAVRSVIESVVNEFNGVKQLMEPVPNFSVRDILAFWSFRELLANAVDEVAYKVKDVSELGKLIKYKLMDYVENDVNPDLVFDMSWFFGYTQKQSESKVGKFGIGMKQAVMVLLTLGYVTKVTVNKYEYIVWVCKGDEPVSADQLNDIVLPPNAGSSTPLIDVLNSMTPKWNEYIPCVFRRELKVPKTGKAVVKLEKLMGTGVNTEEMERVPLLYSRDIVNRTGVYKNGFYQYGLFITFTDINYPINVNKPLDTTEYRLSPTFISENGARIVDYLFADCEKKGTGECQGSELVNEYVSTHMTAEVVNGVEVFELEDSMFIRMLTNMVVGTKRLINEVLRQAFMYVKNEIDKHSLKPKFVVMDEEEDIMKVINDLRGSIAIIIPEYMKMGDLPQGAINVRTLKDILYRGRLYNVFTDKADNPLLELARHVIRASLPLALLLVSYKLGFKSTGISSEKLIGDCYADVEEYREKVRREIGVERLYELTNVAVYTNEGTKNEVAVKLDAKRNDIYIVIGIHATKTSVPEGVLAYSTKLKSVTGETYLIAFNPEYFTSKYYMGRVDINTSTVEYFVHDLFEFVLSVLTHELMHILAGQDVVAIENDTAHGYQFDSVLFKTIFYTPSYVRTFTYLYDMVEKDIEDSFKTEKELKDIASEDPMELTWEDVKAIVEDTILSSLENVDSVDPLIYKTCEDADALGLRCEIFIKDRIIVAGMCEG